VVAYVLYKLFIDSGSATNITIKNYKNGSVFDNVLNNENESAQILTWDTVQ